MSNSDLRRFAFAGMTSAAKVVAFLSPGAAFDVTLLFVMGGAVSVALLPFQTVSSWTGEHSHLTKARLA